MRRHAIVALVALAAAPVRAASDKPVIAAPAAWVKPAPFPADTPAKDTAPIRMLLQDQQIHFAGGAVSHYSEVVFKIATPQGLAAGSISLPWNPETDTVTVHKLQIHRDAQVIDVLASGQSFTVLRREQNLENAILDGVLTANIQPEGLQVGDILDLAVTITSADPALKGHYEAAATGWNAVPVADARLSADWPKGTAMRVRERGQLPPLKTTTAGDASTDSLAMTNVLPVVPPAGAPPRFNGARIVEYSDFADWGSLSALMAPLYAKAATLAPDAKLRAAIATIAAASKDPKARADAALALVQDRVRYVYLGMNDGGLVPADAETTWDRRFGDCKGKTVLLLAMLKELGIEAEPAIANAEGGDGLDEHLPMVGLFDHILVRATIGGRVYWLDGTRTGDTDIDQVRTPAFGWVLPVQPAGATLVRLDQQPLDQPDSETTLALDASGGVGVAAPAHAVTVLRGDAATGLNLQLATLSADALDAGLRQYWQGQYSFITVKSVSAAWDAAHHAETLTMDGAAKMDWTGNQYETDNTSLGYKADFARTPGPNADAPFAIDFPSYGKMTETIRLPRGGKGFTLTNTAPVDTTIAGVQYHRTATLAGDTATIVASTRSLAKEFPAADAPAAQTALRALYDKAVYLDEPQGYVATAGDVDAAMATTPTDAAGFVDRGNMLMNAKRYDGAIADLNHAIALDPKNALAIADRGLAYYDKGDLVRAGADSASASSIDPEGIVPLHLQAMVDIGRLDFAGSRAASVRALAKAPTDPFARWALATADLDAGAFKDAVADCTQLLADGTQKAFGYSCRATAERYLGNENDALTDSANAIALAPDNVDLYLMRASIYHNRGDKAQSEAQAAAVVAANPKSDYAATAAGAIYAANHDDAKANAAFDAALAIKPNASTYLTRLNTRPLGDKAGRKADADAAFKLDPDLTEAIEAEARTDEDGGDNAGAVAVLSRLIAKDPKNANALADRGIAYSRSGQEALAAKDYAAARALTTDPGSLNNFCWRLATRNVALPTALSLCQASVAKQPQDAAAQDSLGFVLLRLGRNDDAIAQYGKALALNPKEGSSLYGRAVAEARKGDAAHSAADVAAARAIDPDIDSRYRSYGVGIDPVRTASANAAAPPTPAH